MSRIEINHVTLFAFGALFYWVLVLLIEPNGPAFATLPDSTIHRTLLVMAGIYSAFLIGDSAGKLLRFKPRPAPKLAGFAVMLCICWITALTFIALKRHELFVPYGDNLARGTLTAITILFLIVALIRASSREEFKLKNIYFSSYFALAILLLMMGQRLYFVSSLLILACYRSCYFKRFKVQRLLIAAAAGIGMVLSIGVLRAGDTTLTLNSLAINLVSEPVYTSISLFDYLKYHHLPVFAFPWPLLFQFGNLVPSFLWPNKAAVLLNTDVYSPLGANNSFIGWMTNFGIVGSMLVALALGFWLRWLRSKNTCLSRVSYSMLCGGLAFNFFRNDFGISVVKDMVENSILLPAILFFVLLLVGSLPFRFRLSRGVRLYIRHPRASSSQAFNADTKIREVPATNTTEEASSARAAPIKP